METTINFNEMNLNEALVNSLASKGFNEASAVQELAIAPILEGKDIFAQAETGSGKTGAFAIPVIEKILRETEETKDTLYLVLSPTRELAQQTHTVFNLFGKSLDVKTACVIGGENMDKQKQELKNGAKVIVATPGRLCDLIKQKAIDLSKCSTVVFDEADRLFDMGFQKDIEFILRKAQKDRQLIMVSATSNFEVINMCYKFHSQPVELKLNVDDLLVDNINHEVAMISAEEKMPFLVNLLKKHEDTYAIVFCNTQVYTHIVAEWLMKLGFEAKPISGRMAQNKRTKLVEDFRSKKVKILVCTDVAARGLDIKGINLVVNYDLPQEAANYVHRIGRTGRAGSTGTAISFCGFRDCEYLDQIQEYIDSKIPKIDVSDGDFFNDIGDKPHIDKKTLKVIEPYSKRKPTTKSYDKKPTYNKASVSTHSNNTQSNKAHTNNKTTERKEYMPSQAKSKNYELSSFSEAQAISSAMKYFNIKDTDLLGKTVLAEGRRKFLIFGSKEIKYRFYVKPIYKKLLTPFYIELFKKMQLKIYVRVSYKKSENKVFINFSGVDLPLMVKDKFELQNSIETITKLHLSQRVNLPRDVKMLFKSDKNDDGKRPRGGKRYEIDEKSLLNLVEKTKKEVLDKNSSVLLKALNPAERRIIHQAISEDKKFASSSHGEGRLKKIEISLV